MLPLALALEYKITYDTFYDNGSASLNDTACSNGEYGLITRNFTTLDSLPDFPYIGGSFAVPRTLHLGSIYFVNMALLTIFCNHIRLELSGLWHMLGIDL